jgi:DNA-binding transcriptional LysR family regulator
MGTLVKLRVAHETEHSTPPLRPPPSPATGRTLVRSPELSELRAFCAAVDLGSIGRAARLIQVSQPALSKRLKALEAVAGTRLLTRSPRGVTPTSPGLRLYAAARRLLSDAESVEALMRGFTTHSDPVRVAASPTIADWWLPPALVSLESLHEHHVSVEVVTANSHIVRDMVRSGRSDIGLAAIDPAAADADLSETVIWRDEIVVAVPIAHPWAQYAEIAPGEFAGSAVIRRDPTANASRIVDAALARAGLAPVDPLAEIGNNAAARAASLAECAPVLLPVDEVRDEPAGGLVAKRVSGMRFEREFSLLLAAGMHELSGPARTLAQHLIAWSEQTAD